MDIASEELRLRELLKKSLVRKKPAHVDQFQARDTTQLNSVFETSHLRVDNFQRPLNVRALKEWLEELYGNSLDNSALWVNAIKTHCYVDLSTASEAESLRVKLNGARWPPTNPSCLVASFTEVSAADAPKSSEAAAKPGDWKKLSSLYSKVESNNQKSTSSASSDVITGKRKAPAMEAGALMLKNAVALAAHSSSGAAEGTPRGQSTRVAGDEESGFSTKRSRIVEVGTEHATSSGVINTRRDRSSNNVVNDKSNKKVVSLDDLFRKTETKPQLYWLPLSDAEVEIKKQNKQNRSLEKDPNIRR